MKRLTSNQIAILLMHNETNNKLLAYDVDNAQDIEVLIKYDLIVRDQFVTGLTYKGAQLVYQIEVLVINLLNPPTV